MATESKLFTAVADPGPLTASPRLKRFAMGMAAAGFLLFVLALATSPQRAWAAFLVNYFFFLCIGLGGLFFAALQYVTGAFWSVPMRRLAEGFAAYLPIATALLLVLLAGVHELYGWTDHEKFHFGPSKAAYLSVPFFAVRLVLYLGLWMLFGWLIIGNSIRQDRVRDPKLTLRNARLSAAFLVLFGITFYLASVDLLMSLEPKWFSTMFGVYAFAGLFLSTLATLALVTLAMRQHTALGELIQPFHVRDIGTFLMAYSCFMMYVGFSQFMLIWYANLPFEAFFMIKRTENGWQYFLAALPVLKWALPFFVLMPDAFRGNPTVLRLIATAILVGQWMDLFWIVYPTFYPHPIAPTWIELGTFLGFAGLFGLAVLTFYSRFSTVAVGDPKLLYSLNGGYLK
ncbi:MAG: hypothetical protein N2561_05205 [Bacteroidetes bacterium]|nr:hypothetical protein [Rhodothermia bacterium]MCS7154922.1 hypothetical protein [Bacteroidota bacterium]MCX7906919.1 hypothetical protein [Bacteroidota bacterium]MDW8137717.1 hypothetical protein [Bacteroidota bacterium]MDW8285329.1 hypothetical protein [Bacteroidota bacterium]